MNSTRRVLQVAASVAVFAHFACATILVGTKQVVPVNTDPSGAEVYDSGSGLTSVTPVDITMSKRSSHTLIIEKESYERVVIQMRRDVSYAWWVAGVFTLGLGIIVDAATGALFDIHPKHVYVVLEPLELGEAGGTAPP